MILETRKNGKKNYLNFPSKFNLIADVQIDTEVQEVPHSWIIPKIRKQKNYLLKKSQKYVQKP